MSNSSDFTSADGEQIRLRGIDLAEAHRQLEILRQPPPPLRLERPCLLGAGLTRLDEDDEKRLLDAWRRCAESGEILKFVPASGAASRMFHHLAEFAQSTTDVQPTTEARQAADRFFDQYERFAFAAELDRLVRKRGGSPQALRHARDRSLVSALLEAESLGYAGLPKGLLLFHGRDDLARTALEDQVAEGLGYLSTGAAASRFHFTVSDEHRERFRRGLSALAEASRPHTIEYGLSVQLPSTDTLALAPNGSPMRHDDGSLLFRPGGHGALIENLAACAAPVVVIKNIDNILPRSRQALVVHWKRLLIGQLVRLRREVHSVLDRLEAGDDACDAAETLLRNELSTELPPSYRALEASRRRAFLIGRLDRPIRVCGMVRNQGEPGGGPFWVRQADGCVTPQIVEWAQIDHQDSEQRAVVAASTHFNPVDLVCSLTARDGSAYPLAEYVDPATAFVADKSVDGKPLRALERPGLWNGAMAGWNSCFVEVPVETFAPVKTVFDLLREEHQES